MSHKGKKQKLVTIEVMGGLVSEVKGLPRGYRYRIKDLDMERVGA